MIEWVEFMQERWGMIYFSNWFISQALAIHGEYDLIVSYEIRLEPMLPDYDW